MTGCPNRSRHRRSHSTANTDVLAGMQSDSTGFCLRGMRMRDGLALIIVSVMALMAGTAMLGDSAVDAVDYDPVLDIYDDFVDLSF